MLLIQSHRKLISLYQFLSNAALVISPLCFAFTDESLLVRFSMISAGLFASFLFSYLAKNVEERSRKVISEVKQGDFLVSRSGSTLKYKITDVGFRHYYIQGVNSNDEFLIAKEKLVESFDLYVDPR